jgi:hypothetical protein
LAAQASVSCHITLYRVVYYVFGWLIDVTNVRVVSIGVHLASTHLVMPCSSGSLIHGSVHRSTM